MDSDKAVVTDLEAMVDVADQGIVSKAIVENEHHKLIHFTLAAGQELSEHTASVPAVIQILQGRGTVIARGRDARGLGRGCSTTCRPSSSTPWSPTRTWCSCSRCSGPEAGTAPGRRATAARRRAPRVRSSAARRRPRLVDLRDRPAGVAEGEHASARPPTRRPSGRAGPVHRLETWWSGSHSPRASPASARTRRRAGRRGDVVSASYRRLRERAVIGRRLRPARPPAGAAMADCAEPCVEQRPARDEHASTPASASRRRATAVETRQAVRRATSAGGDAGAARREHERSVVHERVVPVAAATAGSAASATACRLLLAEVLGQAQLVGEHAAHVGVHRGEVGVVGEDEHGARGVRADARQRAQSLGRARQLGGAAVRRGGDGGLRAGLQPPRPGVVPETLPAPEHLGQGRRGETLEVRPGLQPLREPRRRPAAPASAAA